MDEMDIGIFDPDRAIYGSYSKLILDGEWQTNTSHVEAIIDMDKAELDVMGDDWTRYKRGQKKGSGSFTGYKVTSKMIKQGFKRFELIVTLEDPEAYGCERVRLKNCMVDSIQLANVTAGEIVEEETPFTFEGCEPLDYIEA